MTNEKTEIHSGSSLTGGSLAVVRLRPTDPAAPHPNRRNNYTQHHRSPKSITDAHCYGAAHAAVRRRLEDAARRRAGFSLRLAGAIGGWGGGVGWDGPLAPPRPRATGEALETGGGSLRGLGP